MAAPIRVLPGDCTLRIARPIARSSGGSPREPHTAPRRRACRNAKAPHYHPHDLRHRRITIWHQSGVPARELAERPGHARPSMSLDVYSHVMPAEEVPEGRSRALIGSEAP
jgi:integrase